MILHSRSGKIPTPSIPEVSASLPGRAAPPRAIPRHEWPTWAVALEKLAIPEDKGIGDVIARTIGPIGGNSFKSWYGKIFNKSCGCNARQANYNAKYPLNL